MNQEKNPTVAIPVTNIPEEQMNNQHQHSINVLHSVLDTSNINNLINQLKESIYNRSRVVKFLSIIDICFLIINLGISIFLKNYFWLFFILLPFCVSGYYGASNYQKIYLSAYNFYLFIMTIYYLSITFYYNSFFLLFIFGIELYFFIYACKLFYYLHNASEEILISLREGWKPEQVIIYYY